MNNLDINSLMCRAKKISNGQWVNGYFVMDGRALIIEDLEYMVGNKAVPRSFAHQVVLDTVGRATGRNDKNGTPIFEGDIVKGYGLYPYIVRYGEFNEKVGLGYYYGIGFYLEYIKDATHKVPLSSISCEKGEYEVIGNIYDNEEMLKVAES